MYFCSELAKIRQIVLIRYTDRLQQGSTQGCGWKETSQCCIADVTPVLDTSDEEYSSYNDEDMSLFEELQTLQRRLQFWWKE